ncbi:MAG: diacylglycerol kinase family protein [Pirellulaceae bacterium]|nr:diacylglycerol kinase family protein [Pirellulaceae bacterium]
MTTSRDTVLILHNPKSGFRHAVEIVDGLSNKLCSEGFIAHAHTSLDAFQEQSDLLTQSNRLRAVISAGGDGTASAVAARVPASTPLWLCPLGTENLLARYLGMTTDPNQTAVAITRLKTHKMDAGLANGKLFLIMVGVGFDAEVVRQVHTNRRGHIRRWHYWFPILRSMFQYRFPKLKLSNGESIEAAWYFVHNLPQYAAGLMIAPQAVSNDGLLDVCAFEKGGVWNGLRYFANIRLGRHQNCPDFSHRRISSFRIESTSQNSSNISFQLDGDWGGYLPVEIECLRDRLCLIEPG